MAKRELVQLAHTFNPDKHMIAGWFYSPKLDGQRCFWDGGISRGLPVKEVPYANTEKDGRYINPDYRATGLWSRNGKVVRAPSWWLDRLPHCPLDGELYAGLGKYQFTRSIVADMSADDTWKHVKYMVIDRPDYFSIFGDGIIDTTFMQKNMMGVLDWVLKRVKDLGINPNPNKNPLFEYVYFQLRDENINNDVVELVQQSRLRYSNTVAMNDLEIKLAEYAAIGGEGLMLRKPESTWLPERSHHLLKVKPWNDSEATVIGYVWGRKTAKGSKLLGKMGALVVNWQGKRFELSGFTDAERRLVYKTTGNDASALGDHQGGLPVNTEVVISNQFPLGSTVTFRYRELTDGGLPKEARYFRKP